MRAARRWIWGGLFLGLIGTAASVRAEIVPILVSGDLVPGGSGETLASVVDAGTINESGDVAFIGMLSTGKRAIFGPDGSGGVRLIAQDGDPVPGLGGVLYQLCCISQVRLNDARQLAFVTRLTGGAPGEYAIVRVAPDGSVDAIVRGSDPAADVGGGATYAFLGQPVLNGNGEVLFRTRLTGGAVTAADDLTIHELDAAGVVSLVLREGFPVPGAPGLDVSYSGSPTRDPAFNDAGGILTRAGLSGVGVGAANDSAILGTPSGGPLGIVAREGDALPGAGPGVLLSDMGLNGGFLQNFRGDAVMTAGLTGTGVDASNDGVILRFANGALEIVVREGELPDVGGQIVTGLGISEINQAGDFVFQGSLDGVGAVLLSGADEVQLIVSKSDTPPNRPDLAYLGFVSPALNDAGTVAFLAELYFPNFDVTTGCLRWQSGSLTPILMPGDVIDLAPGVTRTVRDCVMNVITTPDGGRRVLNERGDVVMKVGFEEGGGGLGGIFVQTAPVAPGLPSLAPPGWALLALLVSWAGAGVLRRSGHLTSPSGAIHTERRVRSQ